MQTTKSTYLTRIYILFNELVNHTVGSMHVGTYSIQINIGLERFIVRIILVHNSAAFGYKITIFKTKFKFRCSKWKAKIRTIKNA
jgi:hypothetical protein